MISGKSVHTTGMLEEDRQRVRNTTVGHRASVFPEGDCQLSRSISAALPRNIAVMEWSVYRSSWWPAGEFEA